MGENQIPITKYTELLNIVRQFIFPTSKKDMIQQAKKHGVRHEIINKLECLPYREYRNYEDLINEYETKYHY